MGRQKAGCPGGTWACMLSSLPATRWIPAAGVPCAELRLPRLGQRRAHHSREIAQLDDGRSRRILQGSDHLSRHRRRGGAAVPPAAHQSGAGLHRSGRDPRAVRPGATGRHGALGVDLHHRQSVRDRASGRIRRDLPDVHDRRRAVMGAAPHPAPPRLRAGVGPGAGLLPRHRHHPVRPRSAVGRLRHRRPGARLVLHRRGPAGPGRTEAPEHARGPRQLRRAAVPGSRRGADAVRHRRARPQRRGGCRRRARPRARTGGHRPRPHRGRRPPRATAPVPARGPDPLA